MELKELKTHIESFPDGHKFEYSLSSPFSWRGSYNEVAFDIVDEPSTKEQILENIEKAYKESFYGYKGGTYNYGNYTEVHFEEDYSRWTDGNYCMEWISKVSKEEPIKDNQERLTKMIFK